MMWYIDSNWLMSPDVVCLTLLAVAHLDQGMELFYEMEAPIGCILLPQMIA
jgi:hypothetical protein